MNIGQEITRGLKVLERAAAVRNVGGASTAQTFTWKGVQIPCVPNSVQNLVEIDQGGNAVAVQWTLYVRREHFLTADSTLITVDSDLYTVDNQVPTPVSGRTLSFHGTVYRIIQARESSVQSHFTLILANPNSNR